MDLHHGTIKVEESGPQGSVFLVLLPLDASCYAPHELEGVEAPAEPAVRHDAVEVPAAPQRKPSGESVRRHATVLVVEDDESILDYLSAQLSEHYNVLAAGNGAEGLELSLIHI